MASVLDNIRVVLVGTLYTGNVGSSCRAMANMGFRNLVLAAPNLQNGWDEAERMAVHATDILAARREFATFEEAVADCVAVVGTTARGGLYRQHEKAPPAPQAQKMQLMKNWQTMLQDIGFMNEKQTEHMMQGIHRIFSRGVQTRDDAAIMLGVARQALWAHHNPALEGRKPSIG